MTRSRSISNIDDFIKLIADSMKQLFLDVYVSCNDNFLDFNWSINE